MVICLERGADLHMVPAHLGSPGQMAVKRVCVCVIVVCYSAVKRQRRQCELNPLQTTLQLGLWTSADDAEQCVSFATWTIAGTVSTEHICFCF